MWKFQTNRTKNEEVIAYTSRVLSSEREQPDMTSHAAYKGEREWGNGQMYCFFLWKLSNAFPTQVLQRNRVCLVPYLSKGPIRRSSQTRRVASQTCRVKVLVKGVAITRGRQCLIDSFARGMSLGSSVSTCFNRREDKMLFSINICTWR